jgi:transcriptional regulator with XRE-family HTH domain
MSVRSQQRENAQKRRRHLTADGRRHYNGTCAKRLKKAVEALGSHREVEAKTGVSKSTVSRWFEPHPRGAVEGPTLLTLYRLTRDTDVSVDWLCGHDGIPESRREHAKVGVLENALACRVSEVIAADLNITVAFVKGAVGLTGREMVKWLAAHLKTERVMPTLKTYRQLIQGQVPERGPFSIAGQLEEGSLAKAFFDHIEQAALIAELEVLPSPDGAPPRGSPA